MAVTNSGTGVLVDAAGITLAGFTNAAASNIKIQDNTIYTITSNAVGGAANGVISIPSTSGAVAVLDSNHTFVCTKTSLTAGTNGTEANAALSLKGAKLVLTSDAGVAEGTAPIIGDAQTQIVYRGNGTTWNSLQAGVNIDGSAFVFLGGGDGHLGSHPSASVKNPVLLWNSTTPSAFVLAGNQAWSTSNKPIAMEGFSFTSVSGNNLVSIFTITVSAVSGGKPNNYFFVCKDWTYNVALPNTKPDALRRSYRRANTTASASSYWGAVSVCPTYLHIDLKTSLSASGILNSAPTYLRTISYNEAGVAGSDNAVDVLTLRFAPTVTDSLGAKLSDCSIVVQNTNSNCSSANTIGNFRARLAASGVTDSTGKIVIAEPATKDYTSNLGHRTDSVVIRNRTLTTAWHKWWESGVKLIPIADSRNGVGATAPESYAATDYMAIYRRAGSQFSSASLNMAGPQIASVALTDDANYNSAVSTAGITVSYASGITTTALANGTYTADSIWKAVIDFHAAPSNNEAESVLPFTSWTAREMRFGSNLLIIGSASAIITAGTKVKSLISAKAESFNTAGSPTVTAILEDVNGVRVTVTKSGGEVFNIAARYGTTGAYTSLSFQSGVSTVTYTVPNGQPVEVVMWSLGYVTYSRTISTSSGGVSFVAEMTLNVSINTALDVSRYLSNIALSIDASGVIPKFIVTFNDGMTVSGIELGKAIIHQLVGQQLALESCFPIGSTSSIEINSDEITINLPAVRLDLGGAIAVTGRVYLDFFINTAAAVVMNSAFELNPPRTDGNQVQIFRAKPVLDTSQLVASMVSSGIATSSNIAAVPSLVKTLVEASGGKLDIAMKSAKAAKRQTL
jgi:hypothetical protein